MTENTARPTVEECLSEGAERLAAAGVPQARREARLLLAYVSGRSVVDLVARPERLVDPVAAWREALARRARREPLSHIIGTREFRGLAFEVGPEVLDPRPDSEILVSAALAAAPDRPPAVLDLGTGSGCLLLALLAARPDATGIGIDIDQRAVRLAARNARRLGLAGRARFAVSDWDSALAGRFDLILLNPPYIRRGEIDALDPEVSLFEPRRALDGGEDGLDAYRAVAPRLPSLLEAEGRAVVECGAGTDASVAEILGTAGLVVRETCRDLAGRRRCLVALYPEAGFSGTSGKSRTPGRSGPSLDSCPGFGERGARSAALSVFSGARRRSVSQTAWLDRDSSCPGSNLFCPGCVARGQGFGKRGFGKRAVVG